jgi:hypothetical protein
MSVDTFILVFPAALLVAVVLYGWLDSWVRHQHQPKRETEPLWSEPRKR